MEQTSSTSPSAPASAPPVTLTDSAAARIRVMLDEERKSGPVTCLRIEVQGGGCSGMQYRYVIEKNPPTADDLVIEKDGAVLVIDAVSLPFMSGCIVDFVETLAAAEFEIRNPNSTARCGCGNSFSVM